MKELVFASSNQHKLQEVRAILPDTIQLLSLNDLGISQEIPETGKTLSENSELKARFVFDFLKKAGRQLPVLADDSGLEVMALQGAPGVFSARYAGEPKNDTKNNNKLLEELKRVTHREARFVTVLCFIDGKQVYFFEGEVKGIIAFEPRGSFGFGYDPLFIPRGYRSTLAELGEEVKNSISHRAEALKKFLSFLKHFSF